MAPNKTAAVGADDAADDVLAPNVKGEEGTAAPKAKPAALEAGVFVATTNINGYVRLCLAHNR